MRAQLYAIALTLCCFCFFISMALFIQLRNAQKVQDDEIKELQNLVHNTDTIEQKAPSPRGRMAIIPREQNTPSEFNIDFQGLKQLKDENPDFIGWIMIPDTIIDYPVMQSKDEEEYYLTHDFHKKPSKYGVPFMESACDLISGSDNMIIHGHHMKDGTMFAPLVNYKDEDYYLQHPYIHFSTLTESRNFEIISVFTEQFATIDDDSFLYHRFINATNRKSYEEFITKTKEKSLYEIPATAEYGDQLLTLSTCDQTKKEGRFVVVAREILE